MFAFMANRTNPNIIGTAGGGLDNAGWAANAAVAAQGRAGELATAEVLNRMACPGGPVVLHDLRIPIPGFTANIDHAVVAGRKVWLIDSKRWAPGFYWTFGGRGYRGFGRFKVRDRSGKWAYPAEKQTMAMAFTSISKVLAGTRSSVQTPLVVVWSSRRDASASVRFLSTPGATVVAGTSLRARRFGTAAADPAIVAVLASLVNGQRAVVASPSEW